MTISELYKKSVERGVLASGMTEDKFRENISTDVGLRSYYDYATTQGGMKFHPYDEFKKRIGWEDESTSASSDNIHSSDNIQEWSRPTINNDYYTNLDDYKTRVAVRDNTAVKIPLPPYQINRPTNASDTTGLIDQDKEYMKLKFESDKEAKKDALREHYDLTSSYPGYKTREQALSDQELQKKKESREQRMSEIASSYMTRGEDTYEAIASNAIERSLNTEEGKNAYSRIVNSYRDEFTNTPEYNKIADELISNGSSITQEEFDNKLNEKLIELYGEKINNDYWNEISANGGVMHNYITQASNALEQKNTEAYFASLDSKVNKYNGAAKRFVEKAIELRDAVEQDKGFFGGLGNVIFDIDTWTLGIKDLYDSGKLLYVINKFESNEALSKDEQDLLDAAAAFSAATEYYAPLINKSYNIGEGTGHTLQFGAEFALTAGMGNAISSGTKSAAKTIQRGLSNYLTKKGLHLLSRGLQHNATNAVGRFGTDVLASAFTAAAMTGTIGAPRVNQGVIDRSIGDVGYQFGEDRTIKYNGRSGEQTTREAIINSIGDSAIEYFSETALGSLGNLVSPIAKWVKGTKLAKKTGELISGNRVTNFISDLVGDPKFQEVLNATQFHGAPVEFAEEVFGSVARDMLNIDNTRTIRQSEGAPIMTRDELIETALGVAAATIMLGGLGSANYYAKKQHDKNEIHSLLGDKEKIKQYDTLMSNKTTFDNGVADYINTLLDDSDLEDSTKALILRTLLKKNADIVNKELILRRNIQDAENVIMQQTHTDSGMMYHVNVNGQPGYVVSGVLQLNKYDNAELPVAVNGDIVTVRMEDGSVKQVAARDVQLLEQPQAADGAIEFERRRLTARMNNLDRFKVGDVIYMTENGQPIDGNSSRVVDVTDEGVVAEIIDPNGQPNTTVIPHEVAESGLSTSDELVEDGVESVVLEMNNGSLITMQKTTSGDWMQVAPKDDSMTLWSQEDLDEFIAKGGAKIVNGEQAPSLEVASGNGVVSEDTNNNLSRTAQAIVAARNGDQEAQEKLSQYGIKWGHAGVYRYVGESEVEYLRNDANAKVMGKFDNGRVDVTGNGVSPTSATNADYQIEFKPSQDLYMGEELEGNRTKMKNEETEDGWLEGGYTLSDVAKIKKRNADGTYTVIYDADQGGWVDEAAPSKYPTTQEGKLDWGQMDVPTATEAAIEKFGDKNTAKEYAELQIAQAKKAVAAANKKKATSTDADEFVAQKNAIRQEQQAAQAELSKWENILLGIANYKTAEEQAAAEQAAAQAAAVRAQRKQTIEGVGGTNMAERLAASPRIDGNAGSITAADGTKIPGHYVLVSANALTPSHNPNANFAPSEGYPTVNGQSINDRDYQADQEEQAKVQQVAQTYDGRAITNMPIVSDEGLVYSGNGRTMAGQLAAANGTDGAYKEALLENATQFGFTAEQVESVPNARVVFMTDERLPYNTTTLALFNQTEQQTQSNTASAAANVRKLTPEAVGHIIAAVQEFDTVDAFFGDSRAPFELVNRLIADGIISERDKAAFVDNGRLTNTGKDRLTALLFGTAFDEKTIRLLGDNAKVRNSVMRALPQILENKGLGDFSLFEHINHAIQAIYDMDTNKMSFFEFTRQIDIEGKTASDKYTAFELRLVDAMTNGGVQAFRDILSGFNTRAKESAGGQMDLFTGEVLTIEELTKQILQEYEQREANERGGAQPELAESGVQEGDGEKIETQSVEQIKLTDGRVVTLSTITDKDFALLGDITPIQRSLIAVRANAVQNPDLKLKTAGYCNTTRRLLFHELPSEKKDLPTLRHIYFRTQQEYVNAPNKTQEYRFAADEVLKEIRRRLAYVDSENYPPKQGSATVSRLNDAELAVAEAETDTNPTEAQKKAENYKQGHVTSWGLPFTIENPKGSVRRGTDANGKKWEQVMNNTYGKIRRTEGVDGDHIDVFFGPNLHSDKVFVVDQLNVDTKEFDEHKVMLGFDSMEEAQAAYLSNYEQGWQGMGPVTETTMDEFKKWIESSHRKTKPFNEYKSVKQEGAASSVTNRETTERTPRDNAETTPVQKSVSSEKKASNKTEKTQGSVQNSAQLEQKNVETEQKNAKSNKKTQNVGENTQEAAMRIAKAEADMQEFASKLGAQGVHLISDKEQLPNEEGAAYRAIRNGVNVMGWYNPKTNQVYIYLPNANNLQEVYKTLLHEFVAHKGLRDMLGKENFDQLCHEVWDMMSEQDKLQYALYVKNNTAVGSKAMQELMDGMTEEEKAALLSDTKLQLAAADEYMAHFAETGVSEQDRSIWQRIVDAVRDLLRKAGINLRLTDADIARLLYESSSRLSSDMTMRERSQQIAKNNKVVENIGNLDLKARLNDDVMFKLGTQVADMGDNTLVGLHNLSATKLRKAIKQGGLANPSAAVIDIAKQDHEQYGEISLIMPSSLVDSATGQNAGTYTGDIWSPTYPYIERKMNSKGTDKYYETINKVFENAPVGIKNRIQVIFVNMLDNQGNPDNLAYWYMLEKGIAPTDVIINSGISDDIKQRFEPLRDKHFVSDMNAEERGLLLSLAAELEGKTTEDLLQVAQEAKARFEAVLANEKASGFSKRIATEAIDEIDTYGVRFNLLSETFRKINEAIDKDGGVDVNASIGAAVNYVQENGLKDDFDSWLDNLDNRFGIEEVIFDGYNRNGDRKYIKHTLENASRIMNQQPIQNASSHGGLSATRGQLVERMSTLAQIRANKHRLAVINEYEDEQWKAMQDEWFNKIINPLSNMQQIDSNHFINMDIAEQRLLEAIMKKDPIAHLNREYGYSIAKDSEFAKSLKDLMQRLKELPSKYFETKFKRPVYLNEFVSAVVPQNLPQDLKDGLANAGVELYEYDEAQDGSRREATLQATESDDVRFKVGYDPMNDQTLNRAAAREMADIKASAERNGTYLKAPNGENTNLTPRQWLQVRTKAFKEWFGDWESKFRIAKLRESNPIIATGNEYEGKYELNNKSAAEYILNSLRGKYTNNDTGNEIIISRRGAEKVTRHDAENEIHLKSIALIPQMIENSIYMGELPNEKGLNGFDTYRYYVVGLKINGDDYTAKLAIGYIGRESYYDHALTHIEKGKLLNDIDLIKRRFDTKEFDFERKDTKLFSILQINLQESENFSQIVDENGEPMVVFHGTPRYSRKRFFAFNTNNGAAWFTPAKRYAEVFAKSDQDAISTLYETYISMHNPANVGDIDMEVTTDRLNTLAYGLSIPLAELEECVSKVEDVTYLWNLTQSKPFADLLKKYEYDGIQAREAGVNSYGVFTPNQIKSATENVGTFDDSSDDIRFRISNENQRIFVSNAEKAVEGIKQDKATPQQWLAMLEKNGGIKAGEDKWLGLSEWLKEQDKKSITKQEILDFISENQIQIEEVAYSAKPKDEVFEEYKKEFRDYYFEAQDNNAESPQDVAWERMIEEHGEDFGLGFWAFGPELQVEEDSDYTNWEYENETNERPINETRLDYTTEGLENKREIALTVPTIESWNEGDEVHFGDAGGGRAVAWVRFGETSIPNENNPKTKEFLDAEEERKNFSRKMMEKYGLTYTEGDMSRDELQQDLEITKRISQLKDAQEKIKVLVIDEIQSKRHQEGREKGYVNTEGITAEKQSNGVWHIMKDGALIAPIQTWQANTEEEAIEKYVSNQIPDAPFDKNWHELAMKRMLRYAAENGYDYVAWTTGAQQAERYNIGDSIESLEASDWDVNSYISPNPTKYVEIEGKESSEIDFYVDKEGRIYAPSHNFIHEGDRLSDVVGKELALQILQDGHQTFDPDNARIGGEGMKGFYDRMLPSFVSKYTKKWGAKVQDINLPNLEESAQTMHAVNVTESMKEDVMAGQPMFRITEEENRTPLTEAQQLIFDGLSEVAADAGIDIVEVSEEEALKAIENSSNKPFTNPIDGKILGYAQGGTIYLTKAGMTPETVVHEYTHVWAKAMQRNNRAGWENIKEIFKQSPLWEYVKNDPNYKDRLTTDDAICSEVLARFSSKQGAERLDEVAREFIYEEQQKGGSLGAARVRQFINHARQAIKSFWKWVGKNLFGITKFDSMEDVADRVLYDLLNATELKVDRSDTTIESSIEMPSEEFRAAMRAWNAANPYPIYTEGESLGAFSDRLTAWKEARDAYRAELWRKSQEKIESADPISEPMVAGSKPVRKKDETPLEYAQRLKQWQNAQIDSQLSEEYTAEMNRLAGRLERAKHALVDAALPIEEWQNWLIERGATMTSESNAYQDMFLAQGRVSNAAEELRRDVIQKLTRKIAAIIESKKLDDVDLRWHNMDVPGTKRTINGNKLSVRELIGVYCQAKDCEEAEEKGLPDRGKAGFKNNLDAEYTDIVNAVETRLSREDITELWYLINRATKYALDYDLEAGRISQDTYDEFADRAYYVPQRGWRERDESGLIEEYEPVGKRGHDPYNAALVKARGRQSLAADPFAYIMSIDHSSIVSSENNKIKQKMLQFCLDNEEIGLKTGAFRVKKYWLIHEIDPDTGKIRKDEDGVPITLMSYTEPKAEDFKHDKHVKDEVKRIEKEIAKRKKALEKELAEHGDTNYAKALQRAIANSEAKIEDLNDTLIIAFGATNTHISQRTRDEKLQHEVQVMKDGQRYVIELQDEKVANAINKKFKQHQEALFNVSDKMRNATRFMSAMLTQYNPEFAASNFVRDFQVAVMTLANENPKLLPAFLKNFAVCQRAVMAYAFADKIQDRTKYVDSDMGRLLEEYMKSGAPTGFSYMQDLKTLRKDFDSMVNEGKLSRGVRSAAGIFSMFTEISETAVRFSAYAAARKAGWAINDAAYMSKELTTNFDRAGEMADSGWMSWFSFMRATINGNVKFFRAFKKLPVAYGITAAVYFAMGLINQFANPNDPDDEVWASDYVRENNFVIGKWRIPAAHFMRIFYSAGVNMASWMQGERTFGHAAYNSSMSAFNEILPNYMNIPGAFTEWSDEMERVKAKDPKAVIRELAPTPISPFVDVWANRNFMGGTINREPFVKTQENTKDILMAKDNTLPIYRAITEGIYTAVGGDLNSKYKSDDNAWTALFDVSGSSLEHITEGYLTGGMDMLATTANMIYDAVQGNELTPDKITFIRKFYNQYTPQRAYDQQYWLLKGRVQEYQRKLNDYEENNPDKYELETRSKQYKAYEETNELIWEKIENPTAEDVKQLMEANKQWTKASK